MATIAIDLHGGDFGPSVILPSCFQFFREHPEHSGILVGDFKRVRSLVQHCPTNIRWHDAYSAEIFSDRPSQLLRKDSGSSVEACFKLLKDGQADVIVSAEHTGVLLVLTAKYGNVHPVLKRPVLASTIPTMGRPTLMLDLGASYSVSHEMLLAYAAVGVGLSPARQSKPALAMLNVGTEAFKGSLPLRKADAALRQWENIRYQGFVEASNIFAGNLDVIICDGFTGNSVIKSAEGAMGLAYRTLKDRLSNGYFNRLLAFWFRHELKDALKPLNPDLSNGAIVAGSELMVVKSHGGARERAFRSAVSAAVKYQQEGVCERVSNQLDLFANSKS